MACHFRVAGNISSSDKQGFDRRWNAPNLYIVYLPTTADEVLYAMRQIVDEGIFNQDEVQITCGRHCYEGFVYNEKTKVIIDVTGLKGFGIDPKRGYYIDVGYGNWDMYRLFNNMYGRTIPAGSCYSVGLGGHITGGGYGFLSRFLGLSIDYVTGVDIVAFPGGKPELIQCDVSAPETAELLWAVRGGGGGNFGIITRYYFADPPRAPDDIYLSTINLKWDSLTPTQFQDILNLFSTYECSQDPDTWKQHNILHVFHKSAPNGIVLSSFACYDQIIHGDRSAFEAKLNADILAREDRYKGVAPISHDPVPRIGHPWVDDGRVFTPTNNLPYRRYTYLEGMQALSGSGPNRYGKYKSAYMKRAVPSEQGMAMYQFMTSNDFPGSDLSASLFQIDSYGGRINSVASNASAIPQRSSIMKIQYQTYWFEDSDEGANSALAQANMSWLKTMYARIYSGYGGTPDPVEDRTGTVDGCYFNYCDTDLGVNNGPHTPYANINKAMSLYFGENYLGGSSFSLLGAKKNWNPSDWFRSAQSIPVA
ncbi:FAD-binding protein [Chelatococcus sp. GCM10030263]|uniref:FAD-binding protein n=1 Tax=Chelatococcus sp. GCM10030263 TaxID=3273387 RepID=UPI003617D484